MFGCVSCGVLMRSPFKNQDCNELAGICKLAECCQPCSSEVIAFGDCLLGDECDRDCGNIASVAPSPVVALPKSPTFEVLDDDLYTECIDDFFVYEDCLKKNFLSCVASCFDSVIDVVNLEDVCLAIPSLCRELSCCPPCISAGEQLVACEASAHGCSEDCNVILPAVPSPIAPTFSMPFNFWPVISSAPIAFLPLAPSFINVDDPSGVDFLPFCLDEFTIHQDCVSANFVGCSTCLMGGKTADHDFADACLSIPNLCHEISCCAPCIIAGKAFIACEASARGCLEDCEAMQPAETSPAVPFNLDSPTVTSPAFAPSTTTTTGICNELSVSFSLCLKKNALQCRSNLRCKEIPDDAAMPESCDDMFDSICENYTCCPECAAIGNRVVGCIAENNGCTEISCGRFTSFPPPSSILYFPPVPPVAPFAFAPIAPILLDPLASPTSSPVFNLSSSVVCEIASTAASKCFEKNDCNPLCNASFPESCENVPEICRDATDCCPSCQMEAVTLLECVANKQYGCLIDCTGSMPPIAAPVTVSPNSTTVPVSEAPVGSVSEDSPLDADTGKSVSDAPVDMTKAPGTSAPVYSTTNGPVAAVPVDAKGPATVAPATHSSGTSAPVGTVEIYRETGVPDDTNIEATPAVTESPITTSPVTETSTTVTPAMISALTASPVSNTTSASTRKDSSNALVFTGFLAATATVVAFFCTM